MAVLKVKSERKVLSLVLKLISSGNIIVRMFNLKHECTQHKIQHDSHSEMKIDFWKQKTLNICPPVIPDGFLKLYPPVIPDMNML